MTDRIRLDHLTSDQYDQLCDELEDAREQLRLTDAMRQQNLDAAAAAVQRAEQAEAKVLDYENRITWHTTCGSCARVLDSSIRETERAVKAEAAVARARALANQWTKAGPPPLGTPLARWVDRRLVELNTALNETTSAATEATGHVYLSTGCLHGDHAYCQGMTGLNGGKRPGECKHCGARCICGCHTATEPAPVTPIVDRSFRTHRQTGQAQHDDGPTVTEAAADDRRWPLQKNGE
jgi:hypothetical protein